jgi:hypothetical protein
MTGTTNGLNIRSIHNSSGSNDLVKILNIECRHQSESIWIRRNITINKHGESLIYELTV